jgi:hypothetical protein
MYGVYAVGIVFPITIIVTAYFVGGLAQVPAGKREFAILSSR